MDSYSELLEQISEELECEPNEDTLKCVLHVLQNPDALVIIQK